MYKLLLVIAIIAEVIATSSLKASESLTRLVPTVCVVVGYAIAYYLMSVIVEKVNVGTVYTVWCGAGIILISMVGYFRYGQKLDLPALIGMALIVAGIAVINLFSNSAIR